MAAATQSADHTARARKKTFTAAESKLQRLAQPGSCARSQHARKAPRRGTGWSLHADCAGRLGDGGGMGAAVVGSCMIQVGDCSHQGLSLRGTLGDAW